MSVQSGGFAALALLLAVTGVYGVLAYNVAQRRREIGIRMALGAVPAGVARMVVGEAMIVLLLGLALGLFGAVALSRLLGSLLSTSRPPIHSPTAAPRCCSCSSLSWPR